MAVEIDISTLNFQDLNTLRERIEARVQEMRESGAPQLREEFIAKAAALGLTIDDIVQAGKGKRGRASHGKHHEAAA
jgi:hypothetical protein